MRFRIRSVNNEDFVISSASWSLRLKGKEESSGNCVIEDKVIGARIAPSTKGTYYLEVTYTIADEILIEKAEVVVM